VLKFEAAQNELNFPETNGASEFITYMNTVIENLASFQGKLKSAVLREKNDKDQLNREADNERFNRYFVSKFYLLPSVDLGLMRVSRYGLEMRIDSIGTVKLINAISNRKTMMTMFLLLRSSRMVLSLVQSR